MGPLLQLQLAQEQQAPAIESAHAELLVVAEIVAVEVAWTAEVVTREVLIEEEHDRVVAWAVGFSSRSSFVVAEACLELEVACAGEEVAGACSSSAAMRWDVGSPFCSDQSLEVPADPFESSMGR